MHRDGPRISKKTIHGFHRLRPGYLFAPVPHDTLVSNIPGATQSSTGSKMNICSVYDFVQVAAALAQSVYATITLYNSRGDQINRYGYAAFSLTVAPYALMSVINLIGGLLTSTYPTVYLVRSSIMKEAESRGAYFDGVIGRIEEDPTLASSVGKTFENLDGGSPEEPVLRIPSCPRFRRVLTHRVFDLSRLRHALTPATAPPSPPRQRRVQIPILRKMWSMFSATPICYAIGSIPFAIVGGLSGFRPGESTKTQRVLVLLWLVIGVGVGTSMSLGFRLMGEFVNRIKNEHTNDYSPDHTFQVERITRMDYVIIISCIILYSAPAVGGFIIVGKMLSSMGTVFDLADSFV
ncbi:hypothetical protein BD779DRAFT_1150013 [Infundibulicybe gibba]|nr:hypothetical protein BD779DRAFT_1150013 [Infundibulicybe gibba]